MAGIYVNGRRQQLEAAIAKTRELPAACRAGDYRRILAALNAPGIDTSLADKLGVYFAILCPECGLQAEYPTQHDLPAHSVLCNCGEGHYLLQYTGG